MLPSKWEILCRLRTDSSCADSGPSVASWTASRVRSTGVSMWAMPSSLARVGALGPRPADGTWSKPGFAAQACPHPVLRVDLGATSGYSRATPISDGVTSTTATSALPERKVDAESGGKLLTGRVGLGADEWRGRQGADPSQVHAQHSLSASSMLILAVRAAPAGLDCSPLTRTASMAPRPLV